MVGPSKKEDRRTKMTTQGASAKAAAVTNSQGPRPSSLDRRKGRNKRNRDTFTPIWIQYYKSQSQVSGSNVNKGWGIPVSQFQEFMDQFAGEEDNLYEILKQHPEVGSFLYADGSGRMRVLHHLSPVIHGKSLVAGVEGFGASGEVKVVNCELFVSEIGLESNVVQANAGGTSPAQRVAEKIFFNDFAMCLTLTDKEIDNNFKNFADLPVAEGRIKVMPGIIKMVKAFTQHTAHVIKGSNGRNRRQ